MLASQAFRRIQAARINTETALAMLDSSFDGSESEDAPDEDPSRAQRPPPIRAIKNRRSKSSGELVVAAMGTRLVQKSAMVALGLSELDLPVGAPNLR